MDYDDEGVEIPCEFCKVSFPWSLIAEHQIVCELNPEVIEFAPFIPDDWKSETVLEPRIQENVNVKPAQVVNVPSEPEKPVLKPVEKAIPPKPVVPIELPIELPKVPTNNVENQQNQVKRLTSQTEEFVTKTGEKLLVYGANIDPVEDLDAEKQSSKIPNTLTSNIPKEEDVEDINNLSDDDCEETLEDFWKRARDFLKRNKTRMDC